MINFPTPIPDCDSHSPAILDLFLTSHASIFSIMVFPPLGNSDHVVVSVPIDFPSNSQWDAVFHRIAYDYSHADWDSLHDYLRGIDVLWGIYLNSVLLLAASKFCEWFHVGIGVYIPHRNYQVKPYSSPWCLTACTAAIVHRNQFLLFTNRINFVNVNESSDRLVINAKGFLKLPNLHMLLIKQRMLLGRLVNCQQCSQQK